jgi:hypothetical protein
LSWLPLSKYTYSNIGTQEKTDMTFPAGGIVAIENGDATPARRCDPLSPLKPGSSKCGSGAGDTDLHETPVDARRTPGSLVVSRLERSRGMYSMMRGLNRPGGKGATPVLLSAIRIQFDIISIKSNRC